MIIKEQKEVKNVTVKSEDRNGVKNEARNETEKPIAKKGKILVVDDEKNLVDIVAYNLKKEGYEPLKAYDGEAGLALALSEDPELILLDIMMPKLDGFEVCTRIRKKSQVPIIMLTARVEEVDKVLGFELGADDYVTKPFGVRELIARVKANLRRSKSNNNSDSSNAPPQNGNILMFGELTLDLDLFEARRSGEIIELTRREFELVRYLATQNDQVFTRENLLENVWGYEYLGDVRTVDVTIRRLRTKLEANPNTPKYVLTRRGVGYYFCASDKNDKSSSESKETNKEASKEANKEESKNADKFNGENGGNNP